MYEELHFRVVGNKGEEEQRLALSTNGLDTPSEADMNGGVSLLQEVTRTRMSPHNGDARRLHMNGGISLLQEVTRTHTQVSTSWRWEKAPHDFASYNARFRSSNNTVIPWGSDDHNSRQYLSCKAREKISLRHIRKRHAQQHGRFFENPSLRLGL